jgi:hypothetical protein
MPKQADSHPGAGRPQLDRDEQAVVIGGSVARVLRVSWRNSSRWRLSAVSSLTSLPGGVALRRPGHAEAPRSAGIRSP